MDTTLGHSVYGIDISEHLLNIARRRIAGEAYGVFEGVPLSAQFAIQDIEATPLGPDAPYGPFDAAFFESALHHFVNPIEVLRNVAPALKDHGILCIWEGAAPPRGSEWHSRNFELMRKYRTLERPYTRKQIVQVLELAGFGHFGFFAQVNGFFNTADTNDRRKLDNQIRSEKDWNIVIASRSTDFFVRNGRTAVAGSGRAPETEFIAPSPSAGVDWRGKDLLKENLRFLKRRLLRIVNARRRLLPEHRAREVARAYFEVLGREPDQSGLDHYVAELERGKSPADIRQSLMASEEYRLRQQRGG